VSRKQFVVNAFLRRRSELTSPRNRRCAGIDEPGRCGIHVLGVCAHACRFEQRPDIGASMAANLTSEFRLKIGKPDVIGPTPRTDASGGVPMPAYLVRTADEHDLVGFFVADDLDELLELVDECTAPDACEYLELPSGGIFWDKPGVAVPIAIDENDQPKAESLVQS
jgi:hypothetical protein